MSPSSNPAQRCEQLEGVLESIRDAVVSVNADRYVTLMNSAAMKLFRVEEWRGRPIEDVAKVPRFVDFLQRPDKRDDATVEFELSRGPHRRHILARVVQQQGGGQVVVLRDVTTVRRLERMRRDFVANVSHELRTPISVVRANTETLLDGAIEDREFAPRLIEAVHRNAERLTLIVNDLLDLSRLEAGSYSLHSGRISVLAVAERVAESLQEKAEARGAQVVVNVADDLAVLTDEAALFQVLVNYLENAIKYSPEDSLIELTATRRHHKIRIFVSDDGVGIPKKMLDRVFERFFRVDPGRSREMGGTGLGLSIVKHLVEAMGGRVGVFPVDPQGCSFWLDLPSA